MHFVSTLNVTLGNVGQFFAFALFLPQVPSVETVLHLDLLHALDVVSDVVVDEILALHVALATLATLPAPLLAVDLEDSVAGAHVGQLGDFGRVEATFGVRQADPVPVESARDAVLAQLLGQFALGEDFAGGDAEQEGGQNEDHQRQGGEGAFQGGRGWHLFCVVVSEQMDSLR